ncbi:response regulator transcription factor [Paraburkholderia sp. J7]|uniref:response regulator transcription factor n=1 Tax=Paraburkholderia sp. J7 TaxID=2805438 RepID=UPI002AB68A91|nr:response regulator transcription factor [Paraburkholderia sp. J7]
MTTPSRWLETHVRMLLVHEDDSIALQVVTQMHLAGYEVDWASSKYEAELSLRYRCHDVVLLDFGESAVDALELLRRYRRLGGNAAVVALLPRGLLASPMVVLDGGADDYLITPFDLEDLRSRVRVLMRRPNRTQGPLVLGNLTVNELDYLVLLDGMPVTLRPSEYRLLTALVNEPMRVFTRSELALHLFGRTRAASGSAVDVVVHGLRRKLGSEKIVTIRGVGYRMRQTA